MFPLTRVPFGVPIFDPLPFGVRSGPKCVFVTADCVCFFLGEEREGEGGTPCSFVRVCFVQFVGEGESFVSHQSLANPWRVSFVLCHFWGKV